MADIDNRCIVCGGTIGEEDTCNSCGFLKPEGVSKSDMAILSEGFDLLNSHSFDMAYDTFSKFIRKHDDIAVGYLGLLLSKYYISSIANDVVVDYARDTSISSDIDCETMLSLATGTFREYLKKIVDSISIKNADIIDRASLDKPYDIAILGTNTEEIYNYLVGLGYRLYDSVVPSSRERIVEYYNIKTNAKSMILSITSEEELKAFSHKPLILDYMDRLSLKDVLDGSMIVLTTLDEAVVHTYIPCAIVLNSDKKTLLFDLEKNIADSVGKVSAPKDKVRVKKPIQLDTSINISGYNSVIKGLGIATIVILLALVILYTFVGSHYIVTLIGNIFMLGFSVAILVLASRVFVKATRSIKHLSVMVLSVFMVLISLLGLGSILARNESDWCYRGYWYTDIVGGVEVTNVDYFYTFVSRNVEIPETLQGKSVLAFTLDGHSDIYSVVNVSEYIDIIRINNCRNIKDITISAMGDKDNSIELNNLKNLKTLTIKNADTLRLQLADLDRLSALNLKDVKTIDKLVMKGLPSLKEMWLPETIKDLKEFTIEDMGEFTIYNPSTNTKVFTRLHTSGKFTSSGSESVHGVNYSKFKLKQSN